jgi:hypothetical protein
MVARLFVGAGRRRASLGWRAAGTVRVQPATQTKGCALLIHSQRRRFGDAKLNSRVLRTFLSLIELL